MQSHIKAVKTRNYTQMHTTIIQNSTTMTTENKKHIELINVSNQTIEASFEKISEFAERKGYVITGNNSHANINIPTNLIGMNKSLSFDSGRHKKTLRNYINRLHKKVNMPTANKFFHFLFRKIYKLDDSPSVEYSEKEIKIQAARKAWKKVAVESEKLRIAYRLEKGDFYKKASQQQAAA